MVEKELKWYDIFVVLFGTILSFADLITDILTLVEFTAQTTRHGSVLGSHLLFFHVWLFL